MHVQLPGHAVPTASISFDSASLATGSSMSSEDDGLRGLAVAQQAVPRQVAQSQGTLLNGLSTMSLTSASSDGNHQLGFAPGNMPHMSSHAPHQNQAASNHMQMQLLQLQQQQFQLAARGINLNNNYPTSFQPSPTVFPHAFHNQYQNPQQQQQSMQYYGTPNLQNNHSNHHTSRIDSLSLDRSLSLSHDSQFSAMLQHPQQVIPQLSVSTTASFDSNFSHNQNSPMPIAPHMNQQLSSIAQNIPGFSTIGYAPVHSYSSNTMESSNGIVLNSIASRASSGSSGSSPASASLIPMPSTSLLHP
jgi:hypothetical protein